MIVSLLFLYFLRDSCRNGPKTEGWGFSIRYMPQSTWVRHVLQHPSSPPMHGYEWGTCLTSPLVETCVQGVEHMLHPPKILLSTIKGGAHVWVPFPAPVVKHTAHPLSTAINPAKHHLWWGPPWTSDKGTYITLPPVHHGTTKSKVHVQKCFSLKW